MQIRDFMNPDVVSVTMDDSLETMQRIFKTRGFHHLVVVAEESRRVMGIISDRDLLKHISPNINTARETPRDRATLKKPAHQIMTRKPVTIHVDKSVHDAILMLNDQHVSCLPVVDDQQVLVGILTWRSVIKVFADKIRRP